MPRTKGSKNKKPTGVRITPTVRRETKEWISKRMFTCGLSQGKTIDRLVEMVRSFYER